jgi:hypothetical protein
VAWLTVELVGEERGMAARFFPFCKREGRRRREWMVDVGATAEVPFMRSAAGQGARSRAARGGHAAAFTCPGATTRRVI